MEDNEPVNELFAALCEQLTGQAIFLADQKGIITGWNAGAERFYHLPGEKARSQPITILFPALNIEQSLTTALQQGQFDAVAQIVHTGLPDRNAAFSIRPHYDAGQCGGYTVFARNVFINKDTAEGILEKTSLFRHLIEHSESGISLFDAELKFIYRSPSAAKITGYTDSARTDLAVSEMIHADDMQRVKLLLEELLLTPGRSGSCEFRSRHADGHFIHLECLFTNWLQEPGINAIVLNFRDISKQLKNELDLKQALAKVTTYKYALDEAAIVAITDQTGAITHVNDNFCKISGYSREALLGKDHRLVNSGYHDKEFIRGLWTTIANGKIWHGEMRNRAKNGDHYWVSTTIVPFLNEANKPYKYVAIRFDITSAKAADDALREKSSQVTNLLEGISDGFISLDKDLHYTYVNARVCAMVGMDAETMLGRYIWDLFPDVVGSATYHAIEKAHRERVSVVNEDHYTRLHLWQENRIYPVGGGLSIFISDISERKNTAQQQGLLGEISRIFNSQESLERSLELVLEQLIRFANSATAEVWLSGAEAQQLYLAANAAGDPEVNRIFNIEADVRLMAMGKGLPGKTWESGKPQYWDDLPGHPDFIRQAAAQQAGLRSAIGLPLHNGERIAGVVVLAFAEELPKHFSDKFLVVLGEHLGAEVRRKQLKRELQGIFESVPDIICTISTDRRYKRVNRAMSDLLGYSEEELLASTLDDLVHPDDLEESRQRMKRFKGDLEVLYFENRFRSKTGTTVPLSWSVRRGAEKGILFCVGKDITEKKELEQLLRKSSELARIGSWEIRLPSNKVFWSDVMSDILEVPEGNSPLRGDGKHFFEAEEFERLNAAIGVAIQNRRSFDLVLEAVTAKNNRRWVRIMGEGEYLEGNCTRVYGSLQDIDRQKRDEMKLHEQAQELAASGKRYSDLFHISPLPMFLFDVETLAFINVNYAAIKQYGYSHEEFLAMTLREIRPGSEVARLEMIVRDQARSDHQFRPGVFTHLKKNGDAIQVEIVSSALTHMGRPARLALIVDVTERNRYLEDIEAQNKRLREISWMQSHVVRAPLSRIMGLVALLQELGPDTEDAGEILNYIKVAADELDGVVRSITNNADK